MRFIETPECPTCLNSIESPAHVMFECLALEDKYCSWATHDATEHHVPYDVEERKLEHGHQDHHDETAAAEHSNGVAFAGYT